MMRQQTKLWCDVWYCSLLKKCGRSWTNGFRELALSRVLRSQASTTSCTKLAMLDNMPHERCRAWNLAVLLASTIRLSILQKCHSRRLAKAGRQASRRSEQYIRTCGISALQHSFYDSRLGRCRCSCRCRCRCLVAGREVEVTAGTLAPGGRCNGFDWYVYGSSEKFFGWMPIAVLSSRTFQSTSHCLSLRRAIFGAYRLGGSRCFLQ